MDVQPAQLAPLSAEELAVVRARVLVQRPLHWSITLRLVLEVEAPVDAEDRVVLHQGVVGGILRHAAGGKSDDQQPPLPSHQSAGEVAKLATDGIVGNVDAAPARQFHDRFVDIFGMGVDDVMGAQRGDVGTLVGAPRCGDDDGSGGRTELHRRRTDSARRAVNQQGFAGLQCRSVMQRNVRCLIRREQNRGDVGRHLWRDHQHRARRQQSQLGVATGTRRRHAHHPVAHTAHPR